MAGQQDGVVGQAKQLLPDAGLKLPEIAVREVGPANAAGEDDVADKDHGRVVVFPEVDHVARRMP